MQLTFRNFLLILFLLGTHSLVQAQNNWDFYIDKAGSDSNSGTLPTQPRKSLTGSDQLIRNYFKAHGLVKIGFTPGQTFNESYTPKNSIEIGSSLDPGNMNQFAIFNGMDTFDSGWTLETGTSNTYKQTITHNGFLGGGINAIGEYSYMYVLETDIALEKKLPISSIHALQFVSSLQEVEMTPGSFYEVPERTNPVTVYIHTSDGRPPNHHPAYRYEVTVRDRAVNSYAVNNSRFENLWIKGYGAGYGMLPGGANSTYSQVIFGPGAAIHHVVVKNGFLNHCLFLPGPKNTNGGALVFYDVQGFKRHNTIENSIFLDIPIPVYTHTSGGLNHGALEISNSYFFGNTEGSRIIGSSNNDTVIIKNVYGENYKIGYEGSARKLTIESTIFKDIKQAAISFPVYIINAVLKNTFIKGLSGNHVDGIVMGLKTDLTITNSLIQLSSTSIRDNPAIFIKSTTGRESRIVAKKNIFICDIAKNLNALAGTTNNSDTFISPDVWENNVYILLKGNKITWNYNAGTGRPTVINSFQKWQAISGQDKNSLYIDLRKDPRGLKAVFIDAENGNYTLANTVYGNKIKALGAGMITPPICFLSKPTYEEAAMYIEKGTLPLLNSCRLPCQKTVASIKLKGASQSNNLICQNDTLQFSATAIYPENGKYYQQSNNTSRFLWWDSEERDSSGFFLNTYQRTFESAGSAIIKLQVIDVNGCQTDTSITINLKKAPLRPFLGNDTSNCIGQSMLLGVQEYDSANTYLWSNNLTNVASINIEQAGKYWVRASNGLGCTSSDTIKISALKPIKVSLGPNREFCADSIFTLTPQANGIIKSITWSNESHASSLPITQAGMYAVVVTDTSFCTAKDTIIITNNPLNTLTLPADTSVCGAGNIKLNLNVPSQTKVLWNDGVNNGSRSLPAGQYHFLLTNKACAIVDSFKIESKPIPYFTVRSDTTICQGFSVPLNASVQNAYYRWSTGSQASSIVIKETGLYWAEANLNGCTFRDSMKLKVLPCACDIEMPNAFSPNQDGINDVYKPLFQCYPDKYELNIFSRYGQLLFTSKDYSSAWDGKLNGNPLPVGAYYYVLSFFDLQVMKMVKRAGSITLLK